MFAQATLWELARRAKAGSDEAAEALARHMLDLPQPPTNMAEFIALAPGIPGELTTDLFDRLADAWDTALAEREIRGLPETA